MPPISAAEYMKIRSYVINLIYSSQSEAQKIPSIKELCQQFNVSRPTVCRAMKTLVDDGYVIAKRGVGSFTNPDKCKKYYSPIMKPNPVIGIIFGDGMAVHYSPYLACCLSALAKHLSTLPSIVHMVSLTSPDPEQIYCDLKKESLDALFWFEPRDRQLEVCHRLNEDNFPIVIGKTPSNEFSSVFFGFEEVGYQCGKKLISEGRKNIVFFPNIYPQSIEAEGLKRAYLEAGIPLNDNLFLEDFSNAHEKICEMLSYGIPVDAIYGIMMSHNEMEDYLLKFDPKIHERCAIVSSGVSTPSSNPFHRLEYVMPYEEYGKVSAALIQKALAGNNEIEHHEIEIYLNQQN